MDMWRYSRILDWKKNQLFGAVPNFVQCHHQPTTSHPPPTETNAMSCIKSRCRNKSSRLQHPSFNIKAKSSLLTFRVCGISLVSSVKPSYSIFLGFCSFPGRFPVHKLFSVQGGLNCPPESVPNLWRRLLLAFALPWGVLSHLMGISCLMTCPCHTLYHHPPNIKPA